MFSAPRRPRDLTATLLQSHPGLLRTPSRPRGTRAGGGAGPPPGRGFRQARRGPEQPGTPRPAAARRLHHGSGFRRSQLPPHPSARTSRTRRSRRAASRGRCGAPGPDGLHSPRLVRWPHGAHGERPSLGARRNPRCAPVPIPGPGKGPDQPECEAGPRHGLRRGEPGKGDLTPSLPRPCTRSPAARLAPAGAERDCSAGTRSAPAMGCTGPGSSPGFGNGACAATTLGSVS